MENRAILFRACPLCRRDNRTEPVCSAYSPSGWDLKRCPDCDFVYLETIPDYAATAETLAWDHTFLAWHEERNKAPAQQVLSRVGRSIRIGTHVVRKRRRMDEMIAEMAAPGPVLDVGCGKGTQLAKLPARYIPYGIEISAGQAAYAQETVAQRGGAIMVQPGATGLAQFPAGFFSGIMMRSYLEHESQPREALLGAAHALAAQGVLIIKVPNYGSLNRRVFGRRWCGFRFPDHMNYFTPDTLTRLCAECGLGVRQFSWLDRLPTSDNMWLVAGRA
jgi:SAM-dependent methyltransferase